MSKIIYVVVLLLLTFKMLGQQHYEVDIMSFSSSKYDEFCPFESDEGLIFISNQPHDFLITYQDPHNRSLFNIFIHSYKKDSTARKGKTDIFCKNLVTPYNDGPVAINKDGLLVFSRNLDVEAKSRNFLNQGNSLGLFFAEIEDGNWNLQEAYPYNNSTYNITTPCFGPEGKTLYFASDMPGGYGGTDLYYSERKRNGEWSAPVNLGPVINTPGYEVYPFVSENNELFFASDGHGGYGNKDLFKTSKEIDGWTEPLLLAPPLNSKADDFGLITDADFTEGYFSSNRKRSDDIYSFKTRFPQLVDCDSMLENNYCYEFWDEEYGSIDSIPVTYEWEFSDGSKERGLRVEHCFPGAGDYWAKLNIIDNSTSNTFFTQASMDFQLVDYEQPYISGHNASLAGAPLKMSALHSYVPNFNIAAYTWDFDDGTFDTVPDVEHNFEKAGTYRVKLGLSGSFEGSDKKQIRCVVKEITVFRDNQELAMHLSGQRIYEPVYAEESGENNEAEDFDFSKFNVDPAVEVFRVEVLASEDKVDMKDSIFDPLRATYEIKEFYSAKDSIYSYTVGEFTSLLESYSTYSDVVKKGFESANVKTYVIAELPTDVVAKINKEFAEFADANFEFNEYSVSRDSYRVLDEVARIMLSYPEIVMEIAAHTDNLGSFEYNLLLSQRRAKSIVDYLISKGVPSGRLRANGYGESRPIATNSTEEGREQNRRVEFIIVNQ